MKGSRLLIFLFGLVWLTVATPAMGQSDGDDEDTPHVIQFTGLIVEQGSEIPLYGVHVYVPKAGRGTTSNPYGFFTLPVLAGDSVIISSVGFVNQNVIIPELEEHQYTVVIEMVEDTTYLQEVEILPYPTEQEFRRSILALSDPTVQRQRMLEQNLNNETMVNMLDELPMDPSSSYRRFQEQYQYNVANQNMLPANNLLNPFAWRDLIKSIKSGEFGK